MPITPSMPGSLPPPGKRWLPPVCLPPAQLQQLGAVAPTLADAPAGQVGMGGLFTADLGLTYIAKIHESITMQPSITFYNVTNSQNFDQGNNILSGILQAGGLLRGYGLRQQHDLRPAVHPRDAGLRRVRPGRPARHRVWLETDVLKLRFEAGKVLVVTRASAPAGALFSARWLRAHCRAGYRCHSERSGNLALPGGGLQNEAQGEILRFAQNDRLCSSPKKRSFAQFLESLAELLLRIHHDGSVPSHRLLERLAGDQQKSDSLIAGLNDHFIPAIKKNQ